MTSRKMGIFNPDILRLIRDPSNQALLQGLFRLAMEEEDVRLARAFLDAGADPNANTCVYEAFPIPLRPLQYASLCGNLDLVKVLLRAGAQVDHPDCGWSCSPLLFAIVGLFERHWSHRLAEKPVVEDVGTSAHRDDSDTTDDDGDNVNDTTKLHEDRVGLLLTLIRELLNSGADINATPADLDDPEDSLQEWQDGLCPEKWWYCLIVEKQSALSLGSAFRCPELVSFLIRNGADINFRIHGTRSALRECLYTSHERDCVQDFICETLTDRLGEADEEISRVLETAKILIEAEVDVNDHQACRNCRPSECYCEQDWDLEFYSAFDLGVLTQDQDLINALWSAGAKPTRYSFNIALEARDYNTFCQLLESDADFPKWAATPAEWTFTDDKVCGYRESRYATDTEKTRAMILAAIRLGECAALEYLNRSYDCSNIVGDCSALRDAIEECCARGYLDTLSYFVQNILPRFESCPAFILGSSVAVAIYEGHPEIVDILLEAGADVNAPLSKDKEYTPLHLAILHPKKELVQKLLDRGAALYMPHHGNLLVTAIFCGDRDIIQLLMTHACPNSLGCPSYDDIPFDSFPISTERLELFSPLSSAIYKEQFPIAQQLLEQGASVNPAIHLDGRKSLTPLWAAVYRKSIPAAEWLFGHGADANDMLALHVAARYEDPFMLKLLMKELSSEERRGKSNALDVALKSAVLDGRVENFRLILQSNIFDPRTCPDIIHYALRLPTPHCEEFLPSLIDAGANPEAVITYPKYVCPRPGSYTTLLEAIHQQDPGCVRIILDTGAKTNKQLLLEAAYSPLQLAAFEGNLEIVRMLLTDGHDPNIACSGAILNSYRKSGPRGTSIQNATMMNNLEILKLLLQHGASPNATTEYCGHTALQIACRYGSLELVQLLLEYGANVNMPPAEENGATALQFAAIGGYLGIAYLLLEKGADVNAEPAEKGGRTALEGAAEHGRIDMIQLLMNSGADISGSGGDQYERALERATRNGHVAVAKLLRSFLS